VRGIQVKDSGRSACRIGEVPSSDSMARTGRRRPALLLMRSLLVGCAFVAATAPTHRAEAAAWTYRCAAYHYTIPVPMGWQHVVRTGSNCHAAPSGLIYSTYGVVPSSPDFHTADRRAEFEVVVDPAGRTSLASWVRSLLSETRVMATATAPAHMGPIAAQAIRSTVVLHTAQGDSQHVVVLCIGVHRAGRFYGVEAFVTQDNNAAASSQEAAIARTVASMGLP